MNEDTRTYVITLLESSQERERKIALLHFELDNAAQASRNEMLEAMALGHGTGGGHTEGHISDKTLYIALNYQNKADKLNADSKEEIVTELVKLEAEQERLDYYLLLLEERQAEVLRLTYFKKLPQDRVAKAMGLSVRTVQTLKSKALSALTGMYQFVRELQ